MAFILVESMDGGNCVGHTGIPSHSSRIAEYVSWKQVFLMPQVFTNLIQFIRSFSFKNYVWNTLETSSRRKDLLKGILLILTGLTVLISVGYYLSQPAYAPARLASLLISLGLTIPFLLALFLNHTGHYPSAARICVSSITTGIFILSLVAIEDNGLELLFYLVFPVMLATILLSTKEAVWTTALTLAGLLVIKLTVPEADFVSIPFTTTFFVSLIFLFATYHIRQEEKDSQNALLESEFRYRNLVENSPAAILVFNQSDYMIVDANHKSLLFFDYSYDELCASTMFDLFPPELVKDSLYRQSIQNLFNSNSEQQVSPVECTMVQKDGTPLSCELWITPFPSMEEPLMRASIHTLNENKEMENALFRAHLHTQGLIEAIHSVIIEIDINQTVIFWNVHAQNVFGISPGQAVQRNFFCQSISWDWEPIINAINQSTLKNKVITLHDVRYIRPDQSPGFLELTFIPVKNGRNDLPDIIITGNDVTTQKMMFNQLYQSEKLRALGELASGIAHEINSPMQFISNNLTFLEEEFSRILEPLQRHGSNGSPLHAQGSDRTPEMDFDSWKETIDLGFLLEEIPLAFKESAEGVQRITSIVKAMREFSHPGSREKTPTDLNKSIISTITISRNEWKYSCELNTELDVNLPLVPCYPAEFNQVILNLITNAVDAIQTEVERERYLKGEITIRTELQEDRVVLYFEDNGCGIPDRHLHRIYDPFFTTKELGKGTGQGLTISYNIIVKKLNGTIQVSSEPEQGTRFIIRLPIDPVDEVQLEEEIKAQTVLL